MSTNYGRMITEALEEQRDRNLFRIWTSFYFQKLVKMGKIPLDSRS